MSDRDPLVTFEDFQARYYRELDSGEQARVEALLDDASALVRDAAGDALDDKPDGVVPVVVSAVVRALDNPHGMASEQIGNYRYDAGVAEGTGVYLTKHERRQVRKAAGVPQARSRQLEGELLPETGLWRAPFWWRAKEDGS